MGDAVNSVVTFALRQRLLIVVMMLCMSGLGGAAFMRLNIEAYPDPVPPLVEIIAQKPGQSAEEIERHITIPIEVQLAGMPHITSLRTNSVFGLSDVRVQFTYNVTYDEAEQLVINRLAQMPPLPNGVAAEISPESPIGEIFRYRIVGPPGYSVTDLKTIQDWILERRFRAVPGVIDIEGWGGKTKAYRGEHRPGQAGASWPDRAAGAGGVEQCQHQCRRTDGRTWPAVGGGARRRADPLDG